MTFLKNVFKIYCADIRKISKSVVAIIICLGLCLLPSLYAWVNILACWDPYSNTGDIKVGIVNEDEGASIMDMRVEIGAELTAELKDNKKLGWTFFDTAEEGIEQCKKGNVYATIIVPKDFSQKLLTLADKNPEKPKLQYYSNEKINAIAPKMTDSGANTLQKTITAEFSKTVVEKIFDVLNPLGITLDENMDKAEAFRVLMNLVDNNLPDVDSRIGKLIDAAENGRVSLTDKSEDVNYLKNVLEKSLEYTDKVEENTLSLSETTAKDAKELRGSLDDISAAVDGIATAVDRLGSDVTAAKPDLLARTDDLTIDIGNLITRLDSIAENTDILDEVDTDFIREKIAGIKKGLRTLEEALATLDKAGNMIGANGAVFRRIKNETAQIKKEVEQVIDRVNTSFDKMAAAMDTVSDIIGSIDQNAGRDVILAQIAAAREALEKHPVLFRPILSTLDTLETKIKNGETALDMLALRLSNQLDAVRTRAETKKTNILSALRAVCDTLDTVTRIADTASRVLRYTDDGLSDTVTGARTVLRNLADMLDKTNTLIAKIGDRETDDLSAHIDTLTEHLASLRDNLDKLENEIAASDDVTDILRGISSSCTAIKNVCRTASSLLGDDNIAKIQSALSNAGSAAGDIAGLLQRGIRGSDDIRSFLDELSGDSISVDALKRFRDKYPDYLSDMKDLSAKIRKLSEYLDLKDLASIMQNDAETEGDFFSDPVVLETTRLFPVENYGAGLTPFYTTLCLWVGALILSAMLATSAHNVDFAFTPNQEFVGKYLLYATLAAVQGLIAGLGDVLLLKVPMVHPVLFVLLSVLYSLVFSMIIYCLASLFRSVGKAIGVVFLVLQISGSGGTFPIECTPAFFRAIYRFLPFTYGINGMREAVGGIVWENLAVDIAVIAAYGIGFAVFGLILKRYANRALHKFSEQLEKTNVMGH